MIHRICDFLSPPVSSIVSGTCLDPKHRQPIHLHTAEDQLSYSYEAMDKFVVLFRPVLFVAVSERWLGNARLWTEWCEAFPSGILLYNKLVTAGFTSFMRAYLAICLTLTEHRDIFWDTAENLSAGPAAGIHVTRINSQDTQFDSWHSRQLLYKSTLLRNPLYCLHKGYF
jgi:hypothetical protein